MKKLTFLVAVALLLNSAAFGIMIGGPGGGINITNYGGSLYSLVPQAAPHGPGSQNSDSHLDWLDSLASITTGQVSQYNSIASASLPQPGAEALRDDNASGNADGYTFAVGAYYLVAHYGGANGAFYLEVTDDTEKYFFYQDGDDVPGNKFQVVKTFNNKPDEISDLKAGGLSNMTAFYAGNTSVPDTGSTLVLLGLGLGVLGFLRRRK